MLDRDEVADVFEVVIPHTHFTSVHVEAIGQVNCQMNIGEKRNLVYAHPIRKNENFMKNGGNFDEQILVGKVTVF